MFGMHLRPELVLLQKTMVQVEGVSRALDPKHDMWTATGRHRRIP
jgi:ubiquinone biosynthesis protein